MLSQLSYTPVLEIGYWTLEIGYSDFRLEASDYILRLHSLFSNLYSLRRLRLHPSAPFSILQSLFSNSRSLKIKQRVGFGRA